VTDRPVGATYRLQLTPGSGFDAAAGLVDYLASLGVTHLYLSPVLTARPGSTHGYDVVDPTTVAEALGGEDGLRRLAATAHAAGLGLVVDIVPNHLGVGADNPLWELLLAEGQGGEGARFFDVDWSPALPGAEGKVILPVLGEQYGLVLHRGELQVVAEAGQQPRLRYFDDSFPLSQESREVLDRSGGADALNGIPGRPETWTRMHALLEEQHYRLVWWRIGDAVVNYRRFFAINELAGVRVEDEAVFDHTHATILRLVDEGVIDGLRVDHPDGLRDPARYFQRLAERSGGIWTVAEKITHPGEALPDWPVAGTTGYEFCNDVLGLFVDPAAEEAFTEVAEGPDSGDFDWWAWDGRDDVLDADLTADVLRLGRRLWALTEQDLLARDVGWSDVVTALCEALCEFDVYRTYVDPQTGELGEQDARVLQVVFDESAGRLAGRVGQPLVALGALRRIVTSPAGDSPAQLDFVARFQQLSVAVMAKGVEDTAFYRDRRLLALNEVGGDPRRFGFDVPTFHAANAERAAHHQAGMVTTATHDTKRGEDTRLRIAVLTELGDRWPTLLKRWQERDWSDDDTVSLICQTMIGVWPLAGDLTEDVRDRVDAYLTKALREAGQWTTWHDPSTEFEGEVHAAVERMLADAAFREQMGELAHACGEIAMVSGLAQVLLRCTAPGVPDTYQGNELWDDSLVDPDNRRPVDFQTRRQLLAELEAGPVDAAALWAARRDGRVKLWVLSQALRTRRQHPGFFGAGAGYQPLRASGEWADHLVGYARTDAAGNAGIVAVAPRLPGAVMGPDLRPPLDEIYGDTALELPPGTWDDVLTDRGGYGNGELPIAEALADLPVALLVRREPR